MTNMTHFLSRRAWVWAIIGAVLGGALMSSGYFFWVIIFSLAWWNMLRLITKYRRDLAKSRS